MTTQQEKLNKISELAEEIVRDALTPGEEQVEIQEVSPLSLNQKLKDAMYEGALSGAFRATRGNQSKVAIKFGLNRATVRRLAKRAGLLTEAA